MRKVDSNPRPSAWGAGTLAIVPTSQHILTQIETPQKESPIPIQFLHLTIFHTRDIGLLLVSD